MVYKIERSPESVHDLDMIFDHLVTSYMALSEPLPEAVEQAARRIRSIEADIQALADLPHQGTLDPELGENCRHVTKHKAIVYFDVDDVRWIVTILAVFFGGQDRQQHMLTRLRKI